MTDNVVYLNPDDVLAEDNSRFGLKKFRVERLMAEILASGGVTTPIEVESISDHESGKKFRLTAGFYRHSAVTTLNETSGAGLLLPAVIHANGSAAERRRRQISENTERENLSPMDKAIAIQKLTAEGVDKMTIRKIFAAPGGRKGLTMQPASNSHINLTLSLLDLPKDAQNRVHDGRISVTAAYALVKAVPEKREAILKQIEEDRLAAIDTDEKDEVKFLESEKKQATQEAKVTEVVGQFEETAKEAEQASTALEEAKKAHAVAMESSVTAFRKSKDATLSKDDKAAAIKEYKDALAHTKETEKAVVELTKDAIAITKDADKLKEKADALKAKQEANKAKLAAARSAKPAKAPKAPAPVTAGEVTKAAAKVGGKGPGNAPQKTVSEIRKIVDELCLPGGAPTVQEIGKLLKACFNGPGTGKQLFTALTKLVGEDAKKK